jgi:hypothetical protein
MLKRFFASLFGASAASPTLVTQWTEGGLYVIPKENGAFVLLKILKVDDQGVHVRIFSNVYSMPPTHVDESALYLTGMNDREEGQLGMGHLPISIQSFSGWNAKFIQQSQVAEEELDGYQMWLEAKGGYF